MLSRLCLCKTRKKLQIVKWNQRNHIFQMQQFLCSLFSIPENVKKKVFPLFCAVEKSTGILIKFWNRWYFISALRVYYSCKILKNCILCYIEKAFACVQQCIIKKYDSTLPGSYFGFAAEWVFLGFGWDDKRMHAWCSWIEVYMVCGCKQLYFTNCLITDYATT